MTKTVLNFENLDLKFVCDLVLGAWNFLNFGKFAKVENLDIVSDFVLRA